MKRAFQSTKKTARVFASSLINTKRHWMVGIQWAVDGSKGNKYTIEMMDDGFACDCPAFRKCKHIDAVEQRIVEA